MRLVTIFILIFLCVHNVSFAQVSSSNLPEELANRTWIIADTTESYKDILNRLEVSIKNIAALTTKNTIKLEVNSIGESIPMRIKSVDKRPQGYKISFYGNEIKYVEISILNKERGISKWREVYANYNGQNKGEIFERIRIDKNCLIEKQFPIKEDENVADVSKNTSVYIDMEEMPIIGTFACENVEDILSNKEGILEVKEGMDWIGLKLEEYLSIATIPKKISGKGNTYALFFKYFYDTKYRFESVQYFSKNIPIAEIEILDSKRVRRKWLGIYNAKTKEREKLSYAGWGEGQCDIIVLKQK